MILYKNKRSGRFFIYLEESGWEHVKLVTPTNQIKILERRFFGGEIEGREKRLVDTGHITALQFQKYREYLKINRDEGLQKFGTGVSKMTGSGWHLKGKKDIPKDNSRNRGAPAMKKIEIDDEVYALLERKAIPFKDRNPNQVLRKLLGLGSLSVPRRQPSTKQRTVNVGKKQPRTDLSVLVQEGILDEGQILLLNYKSERLSRRYEAKISENKLLFEGELYTMSRLVAEILEREGVGIQSKSYRGPEYWYTSDKTNVRQLWDHYLEAAHT